jgi:hypothetical protein
MDERYAAIDVIGKGLVIFSSSVSLAEKLIILFLTSVLL